MSLFLHSLVNSPSLSYSTPWIRRRHLAGYLRHPQDATCLQCCRTQDSWPKGHVQLLASRRQWWHACAGGQEVPVIRGLDLCFISSSDHCGGGEATPRDCIFGSKAFLGLEDTDAAEEYWMHFQTRESMRWRFMASIVQCPQHGRKNVARKTKHMSQSPANSDQGAG